MNPAHFLLHLTGGRFGYIVVCVLLGTWLQAAEKPVIRGKPIKSVTPTSKEATRNVIATNAVARPADISTTNSALTVVGFELLSAFKYEVPEEGSAGTVPKSTAVPAVDPDGQIPATGQSLQWTSCRLERVYASLESGRRFGDRTSLDARPIDVLFWDRSKDQ